MAVTKARDDRPARPGSKSVYYDLSKGAGKTEEVNQGASGGLAPEGYGLANIIGQGSTLGGVENARVANEGVAQRGQEEDEKRFEAAEKFMKSKVEFEKKVAKSEKLMEEGKEGNPVKDAMLEQQKKHDEEAKKKPTATGGQTQVDNPVVTQSAEDTAKEEKLQAKEDAALKENDPEKMEKVQQEKDKVKDQKKESK